MTNFLFVHFLLIISTAIWAMSSLAVARRSRINGIPLALHPLFLVTIFIVLVAIDFGVLYADVAAGREVSFSRRAITELSTVGNAVSIYAILLITAAGGLFFGAAAMKRPTPKPHQTRGAQQAALITFLIILTATLMLFTPILIGALGSGNVLAIAGVRAVIGSESGLLVLCLLMLAPAALLYAANASSIRAGLIVMFVAAIVYFLFGSRFNILMLLYGVLLLMPVRRHISIPAVILAVPVLMLLFSFYVFITRFTYAHDSYGEYLAASGGFFSSMFRSTEMSIAEAMTVHLSETLADREWYESLLAGAVALIPREFIPWKPLGLSTELTMAADPARWFMVRSEWTVGGFTNLVYEMGLFGGALGAFILFFFLGLIIKAKIEAKHFVLWSPLLFIIIVSFMRADVYNVSIKIWSIIFIFIIFTSVNYALRNLINRQLYSRA